MSHTNQTLPAPTSGKQSRSFLQRLVGLVRRPAPAKPKDTRRRVVVRLTGEVGTVYATYEPDYSTVMIDGLTKLQAFRESEIVTFNLPNKKGDS